MQPGQPGLSQTSGMPINICPVSFLNMSNGMLVRFDPPMAVSIETIESGIE